MKEVKIPARQGVADIVREKSKAGQLVSAEELLLTLKKENGSEPEGSEDTVSPEALLKNMMADQGRNSFLFAGNV